MSKFAFRIVYLDIEICQPRYFCVPKFFGTPYFAILAKTLLGITVDEQLTFEDHIIEKVNIANRNMGIIRRTFQFLDKEMFLNLYCAQVRPHLEYANTVWKPYKVKDIDIIEKVQRRATKKLPGFKDLSYEERLRKLGLFTLAFRRLRGDPIEVYKIVSGLSDPETAPDLHLLGETETRGNGRSDEPRDATIYVTTSSQ